MQYKIKECIMLVVDVEYNNKKISTELIVLDHVYNITMTLFSLTHIYFFNVLCFLLRILFVVVLLFATFYIEYFINLIVWFYSRVWLLNKEVNKNPQLAIMILWKFILFLEECWWLIVKCIIWLLFYFNLN